MQLKLPRTFEGFLPYLGPIVFAVIFLLFFPPIYASSDEANTFGMAYVLRDLTVYSNSTEQYLLHTVPRDGKRASVYPPGMSLVLAGLADAGWPNFFLLPLIVHLLSYVIFLKILRFLRIREEYCILFLFFPTLVLYSRTLFSNPVAMCLLLAAFYNYIRPRTPPGLVCGILSGLSLWFRSDAILYFVLFFGFASIEFMTSRPRVDLRRGAWFLGGGLPLVVALLVYQKIVFGGYFTTGYHLLYGEKAMQAFSVGYGLLNVPRYVLLLNILYPLMLVSVFYYRGRYRIEMRVLVLSAIAFFGFYYWFDQSSNYLETLVIGLRFLMPIVPLILIAYAYAIQHLIGDRVRPVLFRSALVVVSLGLVSGDVFISIRHQAYLTRQRDMSRMIYDWTSEKSLIVGDVGVIELMQAVWGQRRVINAADDTLKLNAAVRGFKGDIFAVVLKKSERPDAGTATLRYLESELDTTRTKAVGRLKRDGWELTIYRQPRGAGGHPRGRRAASRSGPKTGTHLPPAGEGRPLGLLALCSVQVSRPAMMWGPSAGETSEELAKLIRQKVK